MALFLAIAGCGPRPSFDVLNHLAYVPTNPDADFDFYQPAGDHGSYRPALVVIHGGAWESGDKSWALDIALVFCPLGYVVLAPDYRLTAGEDPTPWPAQIEDVETALRFFRANAGAFGIDPRRMASLGVSAGGHLATMLALRDDPHGPEGRVSVAVDLDGEQDMTKPGDEVMDDFDDILGNAMGHDKPWSEAELRDISPVYFARRDVSLLAIHGAGDTNVFVANEGWIVDAIKAKGGDASGVVIEGTDGDCHKDCWRVPAALDAIQKFLATRLAEIRTN